MPNPPSPPTNGGAPEPGYLPLSTSQSEHPKGAGLGGRPRPIRARLGGPLASGVAAREAADQWRGGGGRFTCYFLATNRWAHRSARPEERANRRAFPGFPRPCPLPSPQVSRSRWPLRVQTPHSLQSPGMSLFSGSLACFWLTGLTPPPSPSSLGHPDKKQRFLARLPPTPSRKPILGTQSARPFLKQPGLPKSKRENEYLVFLEGFPIQASYVPFVRLDLQASRCSCHSRC